MRSLKFTFCVLIMLSFFSSSGQKRMARAAEGDTVWVIVNHVKADKKEQFEKFVTETFWGSSTKLKGKDQTVFKQTRILYPTKPEEDGTLSYIFLMDPLVAGGDYDIRSLLGKIHGEGKAAEYDSVFNETAARPQTMYVEVQSKN